MSYFGTNFPTGSNLEGGQLLPQLPPPPRRHCSVEVTTRLWCKVLTNYAKVHNWTTATVSHKSTLQKTYEFILLQVFFANCKFLKLILTSYYYKPRQKDQGAFSEQNIVNKLSAKIQKFAIFFRSPQTKYHKFFSIAGGRYKTNKTITQLVHKQN